MLMDLERLQAILKDLTNDVSQPAILPDTTREMLEVRTVHTTLPPLDVCLLTHNTMCFTWFALSFPLCACVSLSLHIHVV